MQRLRFAHLALGLVLAVPGSAFAIRPVPEAKTPIVAVDAADGRALAGTIVVAAESSYWAAFHGSGTECFRAASALLDKPGGKGILVLPLSPTSIRFDEGTRHLEVVAFHPGYCAARPFLGAGQAGFLKWANRENPQGLWGSTASPEPGKPLEIRLDKSNDEPERRLRHLALVAGALGSFCSERGSAHLEAIRAALDAEAAAIAMTPYEKFLARDVGRTPRPIWLPLWGGAMQGNIDEMRRMLDFARQDPTFSIEYSTPLQGGPRRTTRISHEGMETLGPFDIDARNQDGLTTLMLSAQAMQRESVAFLLANGARADVVSGPDGYTAIDLVLARARAEVRENGTTGQEIHVLRMIDTLVAAHPAPTLRGDYREDLADPSRWKLTPHLRDFWTEVREKVAKLEARPVHPARCAINEPARRSLELRTEKPPGP